MKTTNQRHSMAEQKSIAKNRYTRQEWLQEARRRFGNDSAGWKFICPSCGYIATVQEWAEVGAPEGAIAFSCVGRWTGSKKELGDKTGGPCNYTGGGLFQLNPILVEYNGSVISVFDFAD